VQPEQERGDDAEVPSAATERPEQVRVLVVARADDVAVGQDDLGLEQVVDGQAALAGEVAEAAAEREPADPGGRDDPAGRGQTVLVRRAVDLAPGAAAGDPDGPGLGIDLDALQRREVDDDAVVAGAQPGAVVAAAAHREQQPVIAGEADDLGHVGGARALRDERRAAVDHRVVDLPRLVVVGVLGADQAALESGELALCRLRGRAERAQAVPPSGGGDRVGPTVRRAPASVMTRVDRSAAQGGGRWHSQI
jgi:hypothetical protein